MERKQLFSRDVKKAASQGQQKEMEALRPEIETLGPTVEDWLPDLRYHLLMFEGEFQSLPRAKQIEVLRLVASRVRGDQQVRATQGAQAVQQPVLAEINQMRAGLGLGRADQQPATPSRLPVNETGVAATAGVAQFGAEAGVATGVPREPIAVRPRPFTFNQQSLRDQIRQEVIKERGRIAVPE